MDQLDSVDLEGLEPDCVSELESSAGLISQWEAELLQERLQELLQTDEDDEAKAQVQRIKSAVHYGSTICKK